MKKNALSLALAVVFGTAVSASTPVEVVTKESLSPYIGPHMMREVEHVTIGA